MITQTQRESHETPSVFPRQRRRQERVRERQERVRESHEHNNFCFRFFLSTIFLDFFRFHFQTI